MYVGVQSAKGTNTYLNFDIPKDYIEILTQLSVCTNALMLASYTGWLALNSRGMYCAIVIFEKPLKYNLANSRPEMDPRKCEDSAQCQIHIHVYACT